MPLPKHLLDEFEKFIWREEDNSDQFWLIGPDEAIDFLSHLWEQAYLTAVSAVGEEEELCSNFNDYEGCECEQCNTVCGSNIRRSQTLENLKKSFEDTV